MEQGMITCPSCGHEFEMSDALTGRIRKHLEEELLIPQVCSHAGVSQRTLERMFRNEFQMSPLEYTRARRLDRARHELACGLSDSVSQVALESGFKHMGRFSSQFKRQFGRYPSQILR